ncbi:MAG: DUF2808 domain-containing protein [Oscillatoriales cyanobacterium SM2_1_8]|nr:DUF2808 domain-containing protein [Oscillatoriales cyanobacterium SM2_1_8]
MNRVFSYGLGTCLAAGFALGGLPALSQTLAQNNVVIFGPNRDATLSYILPNRRPGVRGSRYRFFAPLPSDRAVAELQILYPAPFVGVFNPERITVLDRRTQKPYTVERAIADPSIGSLRLVFAEPIPAAPNRDLELAIADVSNPRQTGMYPIEVRALGTEANPLFQYLGQWLVSIY